MHSSWGNSFFYVNGAKLYQFKAWNSEIKRYPLRLGNISKDFTVDNMKNTALDGYFYDFSVDYNTIDVSDIIDVHKSLMKKQNKK